MDVVITRCAGLDVHQATSCSKRRSRSGSAANTAGRTLIATSRPRRVSRARYTSPYAARADLGSDLVRAESGASSQSHKMRLEL